jgi:hypothetical protein
MSFFQTYRSSYSLPFALGGISKHWSQPLEGGSARQITNFKSDRILTFAYSPDGRQLAFARGSHTSDAVLISEAK